MNDTVPPSPETAPLKLEILAKEKSDTGKRAIWLFLLVILSAGSLAFFFVSPSIKNLNGSAGSADNYQTLQTEIDSIIQRVQTLEVRVEALNAPAPNMIAPPVHEQAKIDSETVLHVAQLQGDLAGLSSAMTALQTEVKATGAAAAETRETSTAMIASLVAFLQLRDQANAGHAFSNELSALRDASKNATDLQNAAAKLEPFAATGAPTLATLGEDLISREPKIDAELAKSAAQNWWERIVAALQNLVVVRPLHGGTGDALAQLETAMRQGNSAAVMESFKQLPPDLQQTLSDWQKKLEARQQVDEGIAAIAAHFALHPAGKAP